MVHLKHGDEPNIGILLAIGFGEPDRRPDQRFNDFAHCTGPAVGLEPIEIGVPALIDQAAALHDQLEDQRLLGAKVIVEGSIVPLAGRRDDVPDRDAIDAALREQALGRHLDPRSSFFTPQSVP